MQPSGPQGMLAEVKGECTDTGQRLSGPFLPVRASSESLASSPHPGPSRTLSLVQKFVHLCPSVYAVRACLACQRESDWPRQSWLSEARVVSECHVVWAHAGRLGLYGHTGRDLCLGYAIWFMTQGYSLAFRPTPSACCRSCSAMSPEERPCTPSHWLLSRTWWVLAGQ